MSTKSRRQRLMIQELLVPEVSFVEVKWVIEEKLLLSIILVV